MAQPETSDALSISATLDPPLTTSQMTILSATAAATISRERSPTQKRPLPQRISGTTGESDDDVQFIFSAPRRKKKKKRRKEALTASRETAVDYKRRIEPSHISTEDFQRLEQMAEPPEIETPVPSQPLRRGTTGMVQRKEPCHFGDIKGSPWKGVIRSGSLPSITPTMTTTATSNPLSIALNLPKASKLPLKFFPSAPFPSMLWPNESNVRREDIPVARNDWTTQPQEESSYPRQLEGDTHKSMAHPTQHSQNEQVPTEPSFSSQMEGIQIEPLEIFANTGTNPTSTNSNNMSSSSSAMQNFCWTPTPSTENTETRYSLPITTKAGSSSTLAQNVLSSQHTQTPSSVQPDANDRPSKETVTVRVPARLVPEQSVSPRTRTVEIPRPPFPTQEQARQIILYRRAVNSPSRGFAQDSSSPSPMLPDPNGQSQIPSSVTPQSFALPGFQRSQQNPTLNRPQNLRPSSSNVLRKPSLYKVPPWPSPPSPTSPTQMPSFAPRSPTSNVSAGSSNVCMTNLTSGGNGLSDKQRMDMVHAQGFGGRCQFSTPRMMPVTLPRTLPLQSQMPSSPASPPPQPQTNPNKRKHSPNL